MTDGCAMGSGLGYTRPPGDWIAVQQESVHSYLTKASMHSRRSFERPFESQSHVS